VSEYGVWSFDSLVQAIMSSGFMPLPLAQVRNGEEHSYEQNSLTHQ